MNHTTTENENWIKQIWIVPVFVSAIILGVYIPDCDDEGYYRPTQCHTSVGMCWCVDKHGVEMANSRTRGKPNCGEFVNQTA
jgi:hypothetical protein